MAENAWVRVCALQELPELGARVLDVEGLPPIAIFRTASDQVFALRDRCPHKGGPLSQGIVAGETVTCPLHGWAIALQSGQACAPDVGCAPACVLADASHHALHLLLLRGWLWRVDPQHAR